MCETRHAPIRRLLKIPKVLNRAGSKKMQSDIRTYSVIESGKLIGLLIVHVDDLLYAGANVFIDIAESSIKQFRIFEFERVRNNTSAAFTVLEIQKGRTIVSLTSKGLYR